MSDVIDQDGDPGDASATMIDGMGYQFDCSVAIGHSNPMADITWTLKDSEGNVIGTPETDESPAPVNDCDAAGFTGSFTLTASQNHDGGRLECKAFNDQNSDGNTVGIDLGVYSKLISLRQNRETILRFAIFWQ